MAALRCAPCGWRRVLAAGVLMALALVALDIATDYDEDDDAGLRPRGMLFDELDDDGPDDLWTSQSFSSPTLLAHSRPTTAPHAHAPRASQGELGERVHAVCAASAMTALSSLLTLAVWPADRHMPHVRFSHLFSLTPPAPASFSADTPATPVANVTAGAGGGARGERKSAFVGGPERRVWVRESALPAAAWRSGLNLARRTSLTPPPRVHACVPPGSVVHLTSVRAHITSHLISSFPRACHSHSLLPPPISALSQTPASNSPSSPHGGQVVIPGCPQGSTAEAQGGGAGGSRGGGGGGSTAVHLFLSPDAVNWLGLVSPTPSLLPPLPSAHCLPCALPPMRTASHAHCLPCALPPMRTCLPCAPASHAHLPPMRTCLPCAPASHAHLPPMRTASHAHCLPCALPPMRTASHAHCLPCAPASHAHLPPMRTASHAHCLPCAPASHAHCLPCALPPMRTASHAHCLPCALPPMRTASHAHCLPCALPPMRTASHAHCLPCALPPMRTAPPAPASHAHCLPCALPPMRTCLPCALPPMRTCLPCAPASHAHCLPCAPASHAHLLCSNAPRIRMLLVFHASTLSMPFPASLTLPLSPCPSHPAPLAVPLARQSLPDACAFERAMGACMAALHPSPPVQQLLQQENATRLHASYGVFVDVSGGGGWRETGNAQLNEGRGQETLAAAGCSGCPSSNGSTAVECVMRRVTMSFLKDPSKGFTLAASNPHHTAAVADFFHPHRAPALLHATLLRATTCPFGEHVTAAPGPQNLPPGTSAAALQALLAGAVAGGGGGAGDGGGSGGGEEVAVLLPFNNRVTPEQLLLCLHARVAELYALSRTRGLIAVNSSSAEARFIAAHGSAASELFRVQRAVCDSPPLRPITHLKFAKYTIVEERLGVMYCGVPSVASTAWLTWLRARLGLPSEREGHVAVDDRDGGLHELALHFTEAQAVRIITRPDLLRFTFVRNPFSRLASTFRSTVLASHHSLAPTSRDHWSNALFRAVRPIVEAVVREGEGQLSFPSFVRLVGRLMDHSRPLMDSRIAPQVDVCALSTIKYDVVGRVESLLDDARAVVDRVGGAGQNAQLEIFEEDGTGKGADADASLARLYDKDTYEAVKSIYAMDFYVALNNITQPAPHVLHDLLESEL
ncbi:unnamed protein product [Closterium sp. NIES-65]|nr:unnamed protein product [Closterium sp. NIES-65]